MNKFLERDQRMVTLVRTWGHQQGFICVLQELIVPWKAEAEQEAGLTAGTVWGWYLGEESRWTPEGSRECLLHGSSPGGRGRVGRDQFSSSCIFLEPCFVQSTRRWCLKTSPDNFHVLKSSMGSVGEEVFMLSHLHTTQYITFTSLKNESGWMRYKLLSWTVEWVLRALDTNCLGSNPGQSSAANLNHLCFCLICEMEKTEPTSEACFEDWVN